MKTKRIQLTIVSILTTLLTFISPLFLCAVEEGGSQTINPSGQQEEAGLAAQPSNPLEEPGITPEGGLGKEEPQYAPGQLIVKLKEGSSLEDIKDLNAQYNVTQSEKVFKDTSNPQETLTQLKDKLAKLSQEHESWYWQLDKDSQEYKDYIVKIEKEKEELTNQIQAQEALIAKLEQRQKRAPEGATTPNLDNIYVLNANAETNILVMAQEYAGNPAVEYAEPNYIAKVQMVPNDPLYPQQWAHQKTQAELGWDITTGDPSVVVAIVDTGVDYNHEDLAANIWRDVNGNPGKDFTDINTAEYISIGYKLITGEDYVGLDNDPSDYYGHGTHCAGIVGAKGDNGLGVSGVCHNCKIMPVRAGFVIKYESNTYGKLENDDIVNAISYAADNGADIISMSFGGGSDQIIKDAIDYAYNNGVMLVASAGNANRAMKAYPAGYDNVIAVAATAEDDTKAWYSNYGDWVDIAAPGGDNYKDSMILSTVPKTGTLSSPSGYRALQGTSMACPYVAGLAALLLARFPSDTQEMIRLRMMENADPFPVNYTGPYTYIGTGRVNAYNALINNLIIYLSNYSSVEAIGDGDSRLEPGETTEVIVTLKAFIQDALNVSATLTCSDPNITIEQASASYGIILQGQPVDNSANPFRFTVSNDCSVPRTIDFTLTITASGYSKQKHLPLELYDPRVRQITTNTEEQRDPVISGNYIVWNDYRNDSVDIYLYDLSTNTERQITTNTAPQFDPAISGNYIVWNDYRNGNYDIYLYDLSTDTERQITTSTINEFQPAISGNYIVWVDVRNGNSDIYLYDLSTNTERQITTNTEGQYDPAISGNYIVWADERNGNYDIYLYDLSTNTERRITTSTKEQVDPAISGNYIVWKDYRDGNQDIYLYDLSTNTERRITATHSGNPDISGNYIVWDDWRNGNPDIYLYGLNTNTECQITTNTEAQLHPAISGNYIVWEDYRNGNPDIYLYNYNLGDITPPTTPLVTDEGQYVTNTTQLSASWSSSESVSGIAEYQYQILQDSITGAVIKGWTTTGTTLSVTATGLTLKQGKKYFFAVKAKNGAGLWSELWSEVGYSDGITIDTTPPNKPTVSDGGIYTTYASKLSASWHAYESVSGIAEYQYQILQDSITGLVIRDWTSTGTTPSVTATGLTLQSGKAYYFSVKAKNKVGLWSVIGYSNGITVDTTAPTKPQVTDEGAYTSSTTTLSATWSSADVESGIAQYRYKITKDSPTGTTIRVWTSTGTTPSVTATGLTLQSDLAYYFSVKARNKAGLWSLVGYSDGIIVTQ